MSTKPLYSVRDANLSYLKQESSARIEDFIAEISDILYVMNKKITNNIFLFMLKEVDLKFRVY